MLNLDILRFLIQIIGWVYNHRMKMRKMSRLLRFPETKGSFYFSSFPNNTYKLVFSFTQWFSNFLAVPDVVSHSLKISSLCTVNQVQNGIASLIFRFWDIHGANFKCYNMTDPYSQNNILKMRNQKLQTSCIETYQMLRIYVVHNNFPNFSFLCPFKLGFDIPGGIGDVMHSWDTVRHGSFNHLWLQGRFVAWFQNINLKARYRLSWRGKPADKATLDINYHSPHWYNVHYILQMTQGCLHHRRSLQPN